MKLIKKIAVLITVLTMGMPYVYANGDDDPELITLTDLPEDDPTIPKSPSRVRISAYYDGSSIVIASTVAVMADVVITDASSGACFFSGPAAIAPDFRCPVAPAPGSSLIITVTVGSKVYEGCLFL